MELTKEYKENFSDMDSDDSTSLVGLIQPLLLKLLKNQGVWGNSVGQVEIVKLLPGTGLIIHFFMVLRRWTILMGNTRPECF